jgi:hypothetical protein
METKRGISSCSMDVHVAPDEVRVKTVMFDHSDDDDREDFICVTIGFGEVEFDLFFNDYRDDDEDLVTGLQQANDFVGSISASLLKAATAPDGGRS